MAPDVYTVEIQASGDGSDWQTVSAPEPVVATGGLCRNARQVAEFVAANQNVADGELWRVRVWDGLDPDLGTEPSAEYYCPTVLLAGTILLVSYVHVRKS